MYYLGVEVRKMEEKIKIYIPESVNNILLKDMERFEIFKKDGSLNKNEFYNTLIVNYYEQFQQLQSDFFNHIKRTIRNGTDANELEINDMASAILQYVDVRTYQLDNQKLDVTVSMKPTKKSAETIDFIENYYLDNSTLSSYFRNMFASYVLFPQDKRERIIFRKTFESIEEAIANDRRIYFTTINSSKPHIVSPYALANSKEELFNYLICDNNGLPFSYRVSRMLKVVVLNEPRTFADGNTEVFKLMEKHGPQFSYQSRDSFEEIKVYLTERGKHMYRSMYVHRPQYSRIEGDCYYFECSLAQAFNYFSRFGCNALVTAPESLKADLHKYYAIANKAYKRLNSKDIEVPESEDDDTRTEEEGQIG